MGGNKKILHEGDEIDLELSLSTGGACTSHPKPRGKSIPLKINDDFEQGVAESNHMISCFNLVSPVRKRQAQRLRRKEIKMRLMQKKENRAKNNLNLGLRVNRNGKKGAYPNPIRCNTNCTYRGGSTSNDYGAQSTKGRTAQPLVIALVANSNMLAHRPPPQLFSIESPAPIIRNNANSTAGETNIDLNLPVQPPSIPPYIPRATTASSSPISRAPVPARVGPPISMVTATGPTGKTIKGILHKHSRVDAIIHCVCCRHELSAVEFVQHAGVVDVSNPLKCVSIIPF